MVYSVTEAFVTWLSALGYAASTRPPKDAPESPTEFVTVERTSGGVEDLVDHPTMTIQCWAQTETRAEEMGNAIRETMLTSAPPIGVHSIRVNSGPYKHYDESTRCPRYQLYIEVTSQLVE